MSQKMRVPLAQLYFTDEGLQVISDVSQQRKFVLLINDILTLDLDEVGARIKISFEYFEPKRHENSN